MELTVDELKAFKMLLSFLYKKKFILKEEYENLLKVETIIEEELKGR